MGPGEFLALLREGAQAAEAAAAPSPDTAITLPSARVYQALETGAAAEHFVTLHTPGGKHASHAYSGLSAILNEEPGGGVCRLKFAAFYIDVAGENLAPLFEALRTRKAAHIRQHDPQTHDPAPRGAPVVQRIAYRLMDRTAPGGGKERPAGPGRAGA